MYAQGEKIVPVGIEDEMKSSYLGYAMSVIVGRALPDVRDGLKPVHRRILYTMKELGLEHNKAYKKCARIVGECLGKYHPHGDMAVYDALTRMAQDFTMRYPLVDGQGNFGSIDGDLPAAMRYTEARLQEITDYMLQGLDKETVDFMPNFDESLKEPMVLPALLPNLLINGSSGIAVGMATNIPPHNLGEVVDGIIMLIDNPGASVKDLMRAIKGPDFPTGGIICGREGIAQAYSTGKGLLKVRAKASIEKEKGGRERILITELPYQVNKASLVEAIAKLVTNKKIEGISDLRDESDKEGNRIVIELKRDQNAQLVLNQLFKHTALETTFGVIMLALTDGRPRMLNLKQILTCYIEHRREVVLRRTRFLLKQAQDRAHILEGLKIALNHLDEVIKAIRRSKSVPDAKQTLIKKFALSPRQAQAILEMQLQRLTALEREKIDQEYLELIKKIEFYKSVLSSQQKVLSIIKEELTEVKEKFADRRLTSIVAKAEEIELEDLIAEEDVVITISHTGYVKRQPLGAYRRQRRGGVGVTAMETKEEDFIEHLFVASTHDYILIFTDKGKVYWLKVYEIPVGSRASKGKAIVNLIGISQKESISSLVPVKEFSPEKFLVMATRRGLAKKTPLHYFKNPRKDGIIAISLDPQDELIAAALTDGHQEILLATQAGKVIRFNEADVRPMGRQARGVRSISLSKQDKVIGMEIVRPKDTLLTVTSLGFGKRTPFSAYRLQRRGGKGILNIKLTKQNGQAMGVKIVGEKDEIMVITQGGMIVRISAKDIRLTGRNAQGVRIIKLGSADRVASVASVVARQEEQ
jgi:DNA gyrase subunit A